MDNFSSLKNDIIKKDKELKSLANDKKCIQEQNAETLNKYCENEQFIRSLTKQYEELQSSLERIRNFESEDLSKLERCEKQSNIIKQRLDQSREEESKMQQKFNTLSLQLSETKAHYNHAAQLAIQEKNKIFRQFEQEKLEIVEKISKTNQILQELQSIANQLKMEISSLIDSLYTKADSQLQELESKRSSFDIQNQQLLDALCNERQKIQIELSRKEKEYKSLKNISEHNAKTVREELQSKEQLLKSNHDEISSKFQILFESNQNLDAQIEDRQNQMKQLSDDYSLHLEINKSKLDSMKNDFLELKRKRDKLNQDIDKSKTQIQNAERHLEDVRRTISQFKEDWQKYEENINNQETTSTTEISNLKKSLERKIREIKEFEQNKDELTAQEHTNMKILNNAKEEFIRSRDEATTKNEEYKEIKNQLFNLRREISSLRAKIANSSKNHQNFAPLDSPETNQFSMNSFLEQQEKQIAKDSELLLTETDQISNNDESENQDKILSMMKQREELKELSLNFDQLIEEKMEIITKQDEDLAILRNIHKDHQQKLQRIQESNDIEGKIGELLSA